MENLEIGSIFTVDKIRVELQKTQSIVYRSNGNRTRNAAQFLRKIEKIAPMIGIDRFADISYLSPTSYPVFQSCRPNIWTHSEVGQNTGSQGKGPNPVQAKISCLMESIEVFCAEPRSIQMIRGSYNYLKDQHLIANPKPFPSGVKKKVSLSQPLMWSEAYSVELDRTVLVPSEAVYFPFFPLDYQTESIFTVGSNGLGAGATYLEAVVHGLYEVIERHYWHLLEQGQIVCEAIHESELNIDIINNFEELSQGEYELQLYNLRMRGQSNLPVIMCILMGDNNQAYSGVGCSMTLNISIDRAISEAFQVMATMYSGSREDLRFNPKEKPKNIPFFSKTKQPEYRTLTVSALKRKVIDRTFNDLREEYLAIVKWLHQSGFDQIYISNLTRVGVDIPVVRVLVPGLKLTSFFCTACGWTTDKLTKTKFGFGQTP